MEPCTAMTQSTGTDRHYDEQTRQTKIRCHTMQDLIRFHAVCHLSGSFSDALTVSKTDMFKFWNKYSRVLRYLDIVSKYGTCLHTCISHV